MRVAARANARRFVSQIRRKPAAIVDDDRRPFVSMCLDSTTLSFGE